MMLFSSLFMSSHCSRLPFPAFGIVLGSLFVIACSEAGSDPSEGGGSGGTAGATGGNATSGGGTGGDLSTGGSTGGASTGGASTGGASGGAFAGGETGSGGDGSGGEGSGGDGSGGASDEFTLTSTELSDMDMFAEINTCAGDAGQMGFGEAIPLQWSGFPAETMSFALTMIDVTLVDGEDNYLGCHSAFWNVPVSTTSMPDADWTSALSGAMSIRNGYLGPCPNFGGGTKEDTYEFTLYAMADATLSDPAINAQAFGNIADCNALRAALDSASLASVTLTGTSSAVGGN